MKNRTDRNKTFHLLTTVEGFLTHKHIKCGRLASLRDGRPTGMLLVTPFNAKAQHFEIKDNHWRLSPTRSDRAEGDELAQAAT